MEPFEHQAQLFVDSAKNGHIPEQVRVVAEEGVKRMHEAFTSLNSAAQQDTERWKRVVHANYKTAREMERSALRTPQPTLTQRSQRPAPLPLPVPSPRQLGFMLSLCSSS